jgi:hypothetical protein
VDSRGRGALAGAVAAALWAGADPLTRRLFRTPYSDVALLGGAVARGRLETPVGLALHTANGAGFGYVFALLGRRGVADGIVAGLLENTLLWPGMALVDRFHPKRRDGSWPRLLTNPRVFVQASVGHALFGALLGALGPRR